MPQDDVKEKWRAIKGEGKKWWECYQIPFVQMTHEQAKEFFRWDNPDYVRWVNGDRK